MFTFPPVAADQARFDKVVGTCKLEVGYLKVGLATWGQIQSIKG